MANLKSRRYYTDTANFDLRCGICQVGLKGEKGAREHAMQTGREFGSLLPALVEAERLVLWGCQLTV